MTAPAICPFNRYRITLTLAPGFSKVVTANDPEKAWSKFVTMYFGALKPDRRHYTVELESEGGTENKPNE